MTGSDRIWPVGGYAPGLYMCKCSTCGKTHHADKRAWQCADCVIQRLRDPAVLAALPEVQAMIAAAYEAAAQTVATQGDSSATEALGQRICCSGHMCGCRGATVEEWLLHLIRALAPADATAALARIVREAEARGMERAADRARVYASNYEQSSDGRNTFILLAEWADAEAAAILARAEQIERDGK